jgi:hypothetical protein
MNNRGPCSNHNTFPCSSFAFALTLTAISMMSCVRASLTHDADDLIFAFGSSGSITIQGRREGLFAGARSCAQRGSMTFVGDRRGDLPRSILRRAFRPVTLLSGSY